MSSELRKIVETLNDSNSEVFKEAADYLNDSDLDIFASILAEVADKLSLAADLVEDKKTVLPSDIIEMAAVAQAFDESGDEVLRKQASVLDEILITIGADPKAQTAFKKANDEELARLRAKYRGERGEAAYTSAKKEHDEAIGVDEATKAIKNKVKEYRPMEASLSTRYCPDMPGVSLMRIGDNVYQCPVTKKVYDFRSGFVTAKGNKVPGTDVSNQTQHLGFRGTEHMNFSTRDGALNQG
jgi:hypothetical protein